MPATASARASAAKVVTSQARNRGVASTPAVIDVPRGKGHVILMSTNPMWRMNTSGLYALVMNAVMEMAAR